MALSNIFREPKRELIEQAFGFAVVAGVIVCDVVIASLLMRWADGVVVIRSPDFALFIVVAIPLMIAVVLLADWMHQIGEAVCGYMAQHGRDPRPKNRPRG